MPTHELRSNHGRTTDGTETAHAGGTGQLYAAKLSEHLDGRRLLERPSQSSEPEPATLAQHAAMPRIDRAVRQLHAGHHPAATAAERTAHTLVTALISDAADNPDLHVATWLTAEQSLVALSELLEALASNADMAGRDRPCA